MDINVVTTIPYPIDEVFAAMRDKLPELAAFMPNIERIEVESRDESEDGVVRMLNVWQAASSEIPALARPFIDAGKVTWKDHATWLDGDKLCRWTLEMGFMTDRIDCKGTTSYHAIGDDKTELRIKGTLNLDLKGLMPRLMLGKATSTVEGFVGKTIGPNFQKTADALTRYLDAKKTEGTAS